jgi:hypothetical protein
VNVTAPRPRRVYGKALPATRASPENNIDVNMSPMVELEDVVVN